jgi:hypothetical protein
MDDDPCARRPIDSPDVPIVGQGRRSAPRERPREPSANSLRQNGDMSLQIIQYDRYDLCSFLEATDRLKYLRTSVDTSAEPN